MHALIPILASSTNSATTAMGQASSEGGTGNGESSTGAPPTSAERRHLQALEARAVAEATATADAAYVPSPSLLNAPTAAPLLSQVDGPSLAGYEGTESVYVGRSVPISAGGSLTIPIQVSTPGSVVEYAVENKQYDIGFGITAEREEGVTIVKVRTARQRNGEFVFFNALFRLMLRRAPTCLVFLVDGFSFIVILTHCLYSHISPTHGRHCSVNPLFPHRLFCRCPPTSLPSLCQETARVDASGGDAITGKFLVGSVPCMISFQFDNDFSWIREKIVSYKVTVTPPSLQTLGAGRRRRAQACLRAIQEDLSGATSRHKQASDQRTVLESELEQLKLEMEQKMKTLQAVKEEEKWCKQRIDLRKEQQAALQDRLDNGWEDEKEAKE
jgi:outer membrane murein-binding lipoprotein Lpp